MLPKPLQKLYDKAYTEVGSVLRPEQVLRLRRPWHQFAIQAGPGRSILVPEPGRPECRGQAIEHPAFEVRGHVRSRRDAG